MKTESQFRGLSLSAGKVNIHNTDFNNASQSYNHFPIWKKTLILLSLEKLLDLYTFSLGNW